MLVAKTLGVFRTAHRDRTKVNRGTVTRQDIQVQQSRDRICLIRQFRGHTYSKHTLPDQVIGGGHQVETGNRTHRSREDLDVGHLLTSNDKVLARRQICQIDQGPRRRIKPVQEVYRVMEGELPSRRDVVGTVIRDGDL